MRAIKPLTDEQVFCDKFFLYACMHCNFFMTSVSLTSLSVAGAAMMLTQYAAGQRTIGLNLL